MNVIRCQSPAEFLDRAESYLLTREAEHNLPLGLAVQFAEDAADPSHDWLVIESDHKVIGAAMRTPPHNLILSRMAQDAVTCVADILAKEGADLPGVFGGVDETRLFADLWTSHCATTAHVFMHQQVHECIAVTDGLSQPVGQPRMANPEDRERIADFVVGFIEETGAGQMVDDPLATADRMIAKERLLVWDTGEVVTCAYVGRDLPRSSVINYVYTPNEHRGLGYATACVAELTRRELARGKAFCSLFTATHNPISNHVYQKIGYRVIGECDWWKFGEETKS